MILKLENVNKTFSRGGKSVAAISDVSLELARGDFVGVLGPSGAGKTTLLRLIAGLEAPDQGSVSYEGHSLAEMSKSGANLYRRRDVGCVWGSRMLSPGLNVLENVSLPLLLDGAEHRRAEHAARELLVAVNADHCLDVRPDELSDGERQRVAIAQALVTKPRLLLADEPASNLDLIEQDSLLALFQSLASEAKMAVLITDTDATALMRARPILYLRDGELLSTRNEKEIGQLLKLPDNTEEQSSA